MYCSFCNKYIKLKKSIAYFKINIKPFYCLHKCGHEYEKVFNKRRIN